MFYIANKGSQYRWSQDDYIDTLLARTNGWNISFGCNTAEELRMELSTCLGQHLTLEDMDRFRLTLNEHQEEYLPLDDFYNLPKMSCAGAYGRGYHQGLNGKGPFGTWQQLEEDPTPDNAHKTAAWLNGWAKGRQEWICKNQ